MWKLWAKLFGWRYALIKNDYLNVYYLQRIRGTGDTAYYVDIGYTYLLVRDQVYIPLNFKEKDL